MSGEIEGVLQLLRPGSLATFHSFIKIFVEYLPHVRHGIWALLSLKESNVKLSIYRTLATGIPDEKCRGQESSAGNLA